MDSKENRVKLITNPRSRRIEIAPTAVPLEQQQQQHSIVCAGSGLNYRSFREDESLASLESTILAGSLTINDRNCEDDDEEEQEDEYDGEYSNGSYQNTRRRSRAKDGLTTVMEVDENNNNNNNNNNNQMDVDRSLMESSSVLVEDENLLNVNIDAISASELPPSASPMNDDVFFDCSPAKSSPYKSPLDDDDNNDSAITGGGGGGSSNNDDDDDDDKSPAAATTRIEKNKDKFELRVYRDHATFGNRLSPIVSCPNHVSNTTAKSEKNRSKQQPRAASRFVSISHVGGGGHGASLCSSSTFSYNTTSGDSGVGDERTGAYIQLIVEDFNKDVTKHAHSTPNEDEPPCSTSEKQQQQLKSPAIVVTDAASSSSVRKSTKIPQLKMQSMANSSLYRRRVTRLTQHFEEVIKGKGQQPAKKELVQPSKLGAPSFVANKTVRSPSYQSREAQKLLRTSKNRSKISFALSPIKTKHHVNFTTARFNRTRPSSCSDCSSSSAQLDATSASFNACTTGGGSYNCLVSDQSSSSSLCGSYTVNRRSHSASDATPSSIEQSRLQRAIDNKCINVRRRQLTPYYVRPVLLNQQQQQRTRLHANSPSPGNKTISKIVKRKSIGYVSSPIKAQVKPVKELRKMFSPSYNHTLAPKNEGLKKVRNLLEPNVPVINISKS